MKNKYIFSRFLLMSYLMLVLHSGVTHCHFSEFCQTDKTHQHQGYECKHHEYAFHVGIFHFFEHFFENLEHIDHLENDHLIISSTNLLTKVGAKNSSPGPIAYQINSFEEYLELRYDLHEILNLQLTKQLLTDTPSRAPPSLA